jgi:hypothetical protein
VNIYEQEENRIKTVENGIRTRNEIGTRNKIGEKVFGIKIILGKIIRRLIDTI